MKITFYVLNSLNTVSSPNGLETDFLMFVCNLTHTVLHKSKNKLIILDDDHNRLATLDKLLWSFSLTDFIPHDLCIDVGDSMPNGVIKDSIAPVILTNTLPTNFDGVVLNLATQPLALPSLLATPTQNQITNNHNSSHIDVHNNNNSESPQRLLEIIPADDINKQKGRDKYQFYRNLGYQLDVHTIG